jgi:hypothetical protein
MEWGKCTASEVSHISNANQYFVELENANIIKSEWGYKGDAKVKFRSIDDEQKADDFLAMHSKYESLEEA